MTDGELQKLAQHAESLTELAWDALEDEFAHASALIKARGDADMTQEEVARAMGTLRISFVPEKPQRAAAS